MIDVPKVGQRLRHGCFSWLAAHRSDFRWSVADAASRGARLRAFGELIGILTACKRHAAPCAEAAQLDEFALSIVEELDWESQLIRDPRFIVAVLTVAEFLEASGRDSSRMRAIVQRSLLTGVIDALDVVPYRALEIEHLLVRARFVPRPRRRFGNALREAFSRLDKPLPLFTVQDMYALTHIVFYICDDGKRDAGVVAPWEVARLRRLVDISTGLALIDDDPDLIAEMILAHAFLGPADSWLVSTGFSRVLARRAAGGAIPAGGASGDNEFLGCYHPTLMWAYACTVLSASGAA